VHTASVAYSLCTVQLDHAMVLVFRDVKKTQQTSSQSTVIQPYFCCDIRDGRDALNYFGSRQFTEYSQQFQAVNS